MAWVWRPRKSASANGSPSSTSPSRKTPRPRSCWSIRRSFTSKGGITSNEGCLSLPEFREKVTRPRKVTARAQNLKGETFEVTGEELLARALLHETDHLNGKLYISHISALKRDLIKRKIRKLAKIGKW